MNCRSTTLWHWYPRLILHRQSTVRFVWWHSINHCFGWQPTRATYPTSSARQYSPLESSSSCLDAKLIFSPFRALNRSLLFGDVRMAIHCRQVSFKKATTWSSETHRLNKLETTSAPSLIPMVASSGLLRTWITAQVRSFRRTCCADNHNICC